VRGLRLVASSRSTAVSFANAAKAAALILSWTTAYQLLHRAARVQQGQRVLVLGAAGAVGQALLVLGRLAGLELWGTARGVHAALIRELGATPIDYQRDDFTRVLPGGFDVVFDGIGKDGLAVSRRAVSRGSSSCARSSRRDATGYRLRASRAPLPPGPRPRPERPASRPAILPRGARVPRSSGSSRGPSRRDPRPGQRQSGAGRAPLDTAGGVAHHPGEGALPASAPEMG
jgi:hypothetical protein